jgi:ABC-type transporter MlaC component
MKNKTQQISMKLKKTILSMAVFTTALNMANAQEQAQDTVQKTLESLQSDVKNLKKLKVTGYIQAQAQFADSNGIASFAGGNFNANTDKRFTVRRGRVKFTYDNGLSQYVVQLDATQSGVAIKDAYVRFTVPKGKDI